jgi:hypothetical protein
VGLEAGRGNTPGVDVAGILVDGVRGATVRDNNLFGLRSENSRVGNFNGLALRNLNDNILFQCNNVSTLTRGVVVSGQQGTTLQLRNTAFEDIGFAGLVLGERSDNGLALAASLGTQGSTTEPFDNRWLGHRTNVWLPGQAPHMIFSQSGSQGTVLFARPNPGNPNTTFTVPTPPAVPPAQTENEAVGTVPVIINQIPNPHTGVVGCTFNPGPRGGFRVGRQRTVAAGQLQFTGYALQNTRLSRRDLMADLMADTVLRDSLPDLQAFFAAYFGAPIGTELRVEQALADHNLGLAQALNAGLTGSTVHEANQQAFNDLYLATLAAGRTALTPGEQATLAALADQCPYTGGTAVHQARALRNALYGTPLRYPDYPCDDNRDEQRMRQATLDPHSHEARLETFRCYPNPTDGILYLDYRLREDEPAVWELFTLQGQPLLTRTLDPAATRAELDLTGQTAGAYIARIRIGNQTLKAFRVILTE